MEHALHHLLQELGCSPVEIQVYIANLTLGNASASAIARQAAVHRITTYETLKRLADKGYIKMTLGHRKAKHFEPTDIEVLRDLLQQRQKSIAGMLATIDDLKPVFRSMRGGLRDQPDISYFSGSAGVQAIFMDTLRHGRNEILSCSTGEGYVQSGLNKDFLSRYGALRVEKRIPQRIVMPDTPAARGWCTAELDVRELRQTKFVPQAKYVCKNDISVYGDRVAIFSLQPGQEKGIIIRSPGIAEGVATLYELLWQMIP